MGSLSNSLKRTDVRKPSIALPATHFVIFVGHRMAPFDCGSRDTHGYCWVRDVGVAHCGLHSPHSTSCTMNGRMKQELAL